MNFELTGPLSDQLVSSLVVIVFLGIVIIITGIRVGKLKPTDTPKGLLLVFVLFFEAVLNLIKPHFSGKKLKVFGPYLTAVLLYLVFANTVSLFGLKTPASNAGIAACCSIMTYIMLRFANIRFKGIKQKLRDFLGRIWYMFPIMIPINLIGEFSTPLTMGLRLFGNMISGLVISTMVYAVLNWVAGIFAGVFLHVVFDIFFGLIQAFVFFMLSVVNISMATEK